MPTRNPTSTPTSRISDRPASLTDAIGPAAVSLPPTEPLDLSALVVAHLSYAR